MRDIWLYMWVTSFEPFQLREAKSPFSLVNPLKALREIQFGKCGQGNLMHQRSPNGLVGMILNQLSDFFANLFLFWIPIRNNEWERLDFLIGSCHHPRKVRYHRHIVSEISEFVPCHLKTFVKVFILSSHQKLGEIQGDVYLVGMRSAIKEVFEQKCQKIQKSGPCKLLKKNKNPQNPPMKYMLDFSDAVCSPSWRLWNCDNKEIIFYCHDQISYAIFFLNGRPEDFDYALLVIPPLFNCLVVMTGGLITIFRLGDSYRNISPRSINQIWWPTIGTNTTKQVFVQNDQIYRIT